MRARVAGFTLIELMVGLAILGVLIALTIPAFADLRQRAAVRGAADQMASFWANARFEAVKRNSMVKVGFVRNAAGQMCLGAEATTAANDDAHCDCFTAGECDVGQYPSEQSDWRGVGWMAAPTMGDNGTADVGVVVLEPRRGALSEPGDIGNVVLRSNPDVVDYRLQFNVDARGRVVLCEPAAAPDKLPDFVDRRCGAGP